MRKRGCYGSMEEARQREPCRDLRRRLVQSSGWPGEGFSHGCECFGMCIQHPPQEDTTLWAPSAPPPAAPSAPSSPRVLLRLLRLCLRPLRASAHHQQRLQHLHAPDPPGEQLPLSEAPLGAVQPPSALLWCSEALSEDSGASQGAQGASLALGPAQAAYRRPPAAARLWAGQRGVQ